MLYPVERRGRMYVQSSAPASGLDHHTGWSRMAGSLTGQGANNIAQRLRIDPALLQNLVRRGPDLVPDRLVLVCRGLSRRRRWLTRGQLPRSALTRQAEHHLESEPLLKASSRGDASRRGHCHPARA
jgi:hypothetical protein